MVELPLVLNKVCEPTRPVLEPFFFYDLRIPYEKLTLLDLVYHKGKVIYVEEEIIG
jgi:hypothetical protein